MNEEKVLEVRGVSLAYGARRILQDVSLTIHSGDFWFFLGSNGQGKTTLLSAMMGVLTPQAGSIERQSTLAGREQIGYVPQRSEPNPTLPTTVREFVSLGFVGISVTGAQRKERLAGALQRVGLTGTERKSYWALSGGQRQRALVARALVRRPIVLLVDEPTNHLDPVAEHLLLQSLETLNREEKTTVVFVTHDLAVAGRYASHLAFFFDGKVEAGKAGEVLTADRLQRTFGVPFSLHTDDAGSPVPRILSPKGQA